MGLDVFFKQRCSYGVYWLGKAFLEFVKFFWLWWAFMVFNLHWSAVLAFIFNWGLFCLMGLFICGAFLEVCFAWDFFCCGEQSWSLFSLFLRSLKNPFNL